MAALNEPMKLAQLLAVAEDDDAGVTVNDDEVLAVHGQRDAVFGEVTRSWPC